MSSCQDLVVAPRMSLHRAHVADSAVTVIVVVPGHELTRPAARILEACKARGRELWSIFRRAEQRLHKGVIVAHPRPRVRGCDAQPVQHREHRRGFHGRAVVPVKDGFLRHRVDAFGQGRSS